MKPVISLITLGVSDLKRSIQFYQEGLSLPLRQPTDEIAFFTLKGAWLALFTQAALAADANVSSAGSGFSSVTIAHNVPAKEEVDAVLQEVIQAGATIVKAAETATWGGYSGYFADPDGHLWEVAWNPFLEIK
jgi:catechol 2,3-dioxygenase-like lactoylglutathione lyase family enzyme